MKIAITRFLLILCAAIAGFAMGRFTKDCDTPVPFRLTQGADLTMPQVGDIEYNGATTRIFINGGWYILDTTLKNTK